jgi:hypothetical protein
MARIEVREVKSEKDLFEYEVEIRDNGTSSLHRVKVGREDYEKLTGGRIPPEVLVEKSFEFLLEREPKESILKSFNLSIISNYFREYPGMIKNNF